ncbi:MULTISPECIES: hypothetical protein [Actinomycetaceae]|uniref:Uncharacterized protein n=1 Tax=Actinotignum sanguinis TaxID=1445614 RepID=A0ABT5V800_9ACTO|nr:MULTISPECIES: hypothetical protein [Actinotignum]MDE1552494.1 hypothetical protein [Actinotignum sanguinis]MDE1642042.1 hypothetical protein [Actinotignum sanguinis]MDE1656914.1 hypothetical protein [Actinotignum sanguinis]MDK6907280.1 hypothetical protein [Actinotignum timonense]MDK8353350.1 hypothetical protein [Actinotignum sanguinis]
MSEQTEDVMDETVESLAALLKAASMIVARVQTEYATHVQRSAQRAATAQQAFTAQLGVARPFLAQASNERWWDSASALDIARMYGLAAKYAGADPLAAQALARVSSFLEDHGITADMINGADTDSLTPEQVDKLTAALDAKPDVATPDKTPAATTRTAATTPKAGVPGAGVESEAAEPAAPVLGIEAMKQRIAQMREKAAAAGIKFGEATGEGALTGELSVQAACPGNPAARAAAVAMPGKKKQKAENVTSEQISLSK